MHLEKCHAPILRTIAIGYISLNLLGREIKIDRFVPVFNNLLVEMCIFIDQPFHMSIHTKAGK